MTLPPPLQQVDRTYVRHQGRKLSYFAGCDYFRLASHPQVLQAAAVALQRFGLNVSASRMTTGNHPLYEQLEKSLVHFFGAESATLASNGYSPNLMVAQAWAGKFSHVLMDERAHGCLVDAALILDCPVLKFKHRDPAHLAQLLKRLGKIHPILLTDGMFSHDGGIAPLKKYLAALPKNATMLVDDAHGAGVLGKNGRGSLEHAGIASTRVIQTITLSKAFGVYGGAVLGPRSLREEIIDRSRVFIGNTPLPLPLANAALKSVHILKNNGQLRIRLRRNIDYIRTKLSAKGLAAGDSTGPILPIIPKNAALAGQLKKKLLAQNIFPPFIKYPGGPANGYFRFAISSEHSQEQLDALAAALVG